MCSFRFLYCPQVLLVVLSILSAVSVWNSVAVVWISWTMLSYELVIILHSRLLRIWLLLGKHLPLERARLWVSLRICIVGFENGDILWRGSMLGIKFVLVGVLWRSMLASSVLSGSTLPLDIQWVILPILQGLRKSCSCAKGFCRLLPLFLLLYLISFLFLFLDLVFNL